MAAGTLATDLFAAEASASFLSAMAAFGAIVGAAAAFGAIFVPWPFSDGARRGSVPGDPDLHYEILPGDAKLTLRRDTADGRQWVADAYRRQDGVYIERDTGTPIAREISGSLVFDADTLASVSAEDSEQDARSDAVVTTDVEAESNKPKICPDPGPDVPHGASDKSWKYQYQIAQLVNGIHGLPPGLAISLINPLTGRRVTYDECRLTNGALIEAKGPAFARLIKDPHLADVIEKRWVNQATPQLNASEGRPLEWYFAELEAQEFARKKFAQSGLTSIKTIHEPYREH